MNKNNRTIKIKKASAQSLDAFWDLFSETVRNQFPEYSLKVKNYFLKKYWIKKNIKKWLKNKTITLLVALDNNEIIGYLMTEHPFGGIAYIIWLAVEKSFQSKGIGSQLLEKYEVIAKKQGIHKIHLWTNKRNIKFYKKNGYKLVGCIPQNYFGSDDYLFYREIQIPRFANKVNPLY